MKTVWLVNPYGPIEGENWRAYSFNQFGKFLSNQGFKVVWWTSNFAHHFKEFRSEGSKDITVNDNFIIRLVQTTSYKKNFSFGRFRKDIVFAKNAYKEFKVGRRPDIIISADNPLTMKYPSFKFAKDHNIPIIYDQMDLWPEFIENVAGNGMSKLLHILFKPVYKQRKKNYQQLDGVIALGKNYLEKAKEIEQSLENKPQALIYNGIDVMKFREKLVNSIKIGSIPQKGEKDIWCVFAGTLGPSYDIETIIKCAKRLSKDGNNHVRFIVAGSGPLEDIVVRADSELINFNYIGKLLPDELIPIYGKCDIGLATYSSMSNVDMPDKFYDYTAAGLAIINSLNGEIFEHIEEQKIGYNYLPGNLDDFYRVIQNLSDEEQLGQCKKRSFELAIKFDENIQNEKLLKLINLITK
ncbi:glycosyltransferase family 4 protein [Paenibacillus hemerocallicola]|uniref:Glycosyltransferase family 4 protein n=1 Tax=Paenibacillus hemerocallicola TaxID=1172614 RepID=A0A5C4TCF8_9BACL|nr:glycosyltransferase family 4 protein [Paenibacillus hemerocallicola]TNJ66753.1 glycosyltransferase family 4 protein [Paenibacillus hemerocallicola]